MTEAIVKEIINDVKNNLRINKNDFNKFFMVIKF